MKCHHCQAEFEFTENPPNAFIGCVEGDNGKAADGEVILCKKCYYFSLMGHNPFKPWLYSYPMAYRAKFIPPGAKISVHNLGGSLPPNKAKDAYDELKVRTAYAEALGMAAEDIPRTSWMSRE